MNLSITTNASHLYLASGQWSYVFGALNIPISSTALSGSLLCFWMVWKMKNELKDTTKAVFISLSLSTFCCGTSLAYNAYTTMSIMFGVTFSGDSKLCTFMGFFYFLSLHSAIACQAAVSVNRFFAVVLQSHFPSVGSRSCGLFVAVIPWILSFVGCMFPLFHLGGVYGFNQPSGKCIVISTAAEIAYTRFYRSFYPCGTLACMIFCNGAVLVKVYSSSRRVHCHRGQQIFMTESQDTKTELENPVTVVALITCAVFTACCIPQMVHGFIGKSQADLKHPVGESLVVLFLTGIALGPWITVGISGKLMKTRLSRTLKRVHALPQSPEAMLESRNQSIKESRTYKTANS